MQRLGLRELPLGGEQMGRGLVELAQGVVQGVRGDDELLLEGGVSWPRSACTSPRSALTFALAFETCCFVTADPLPVGTTTMTTRHSVAARYRDALGKRLGELVIEGIYPYRRRGGSDNPATGGSLTPRGTRCNHRARRGL